MIHLVVTYSDHQIGFYPVPENQGWKIDSAKRTIVIGKGIPRTMVPLDNVQRIDIEECHPQPIDLTEHER